MAFLVIDAQSAFAADITGSVKVKQAGNVKLAEGYFGRDSSGKSASCMAGGTADATSDGYVSCTTFRPRITTLKWKGGKLSFVHTKLAPGTYCAYAKAGERYTQWRAVRLKKATQTAQLDFTLDPSDAGTLELLLADKRSDYRIHYAPLDAKGRDIAPGVDLSDSFESELKISGGRCRATGIRPGKYRLKLMRVKSSGDTQQMGTWQDLEDAGAMLVTVKPRMLSTYKVPSRK